MANRKKEVFKPGPMTEEKRNIIQGLLQEYDIKSAAYIQEALKGLLGETIKEIMEDYRTDTRIRRSRERQDKRPLRGRP